MHGPAIAKDTSYSLDVLGQQPFLKMYTPICLCFPVIDASSHPAIIATLTNGLERLYASFPWLAGKVVNEGSGSGNTGIFKVKPSEEIPRLVVKDLRDDPSAPTMDALRRANFPFSRLDEAIISPRKTLPGGADESTSDSAPVFLVQANFITGGLLLTFVGQHQTMDMTGEGQIIDLFSKACRNEQFTSDELTSGNLARHDLIPLLDDSYKPGPELAREIAKPPPSHPGSNSTDDRPTPPPPPKCTWTYFTFHPTALADLKSLATETITLPSGYISTDDALSALVWQAVIRARLPRLNPTTDATFARAVDVRRYLDIPQTYPGVMLMMTYHTDTVEKLAEAPLGAVASQLRSALDPKSSDLAYHTRALATFMNRTPDKNTISFLASLDLSADFMLSSWAKLNVYELDFNLGLGKPEAARRPRPVEFAGLAYLMPRSLDGEIALAICLRDDDMERLKGDEEFAKYGSFVG